VPDDQLSLAIGREGQNARLAARLTGWRVDIRSETEFAAEEAEHGYEEEEVQGRCAAVLSNGRRCPNAALPNSRYCGLETHQALANIDSDNIADLTVAGSEAPTGNVVETPTGADQVAAVAGEPTEAGGEARELAAAEGADAGPVAHDVAEETGPLGETEAAVIAPEPTEDGAEAARELAEKLEAEAPAEEPAP
jgi:N utilization substance protein A